METILLQYLVLFRNNLTIEPSSSELGFISSLTKCKYLTYLALDENPFNGVLPASIGSLSAFLQKFYAGSCGIKGTIPSEIGNLTNLILLALGNNKLTGGLPTTAKNLQNLRGLSLSRNNIIGSLDHFCLQSLTELYIYQNQISGSLPECFATLTSLRILDLTNNLLASAIPRSFYNLKDLLHLNASSDILIGPLPQEIGDLKAAISIDLSMNQFSGEIPSTVSDLKNSLNLSLAHSNLVGSIPESIGKMGPFKTLTSKSFISNGALCGDSKFHVAKCQHDTSNPRSRAEKILVIVFISLGIAIVNAMVSACLFRRYRKKEVASGGTTRVVVSTQERVSHYELLQATDGYNKSNLLGIGSSGSVYKGTLNDGRTVAVKVFNLQLEGALKSFDVECEVLRNLRHRNLVKVISSCSNQDFKDLVLEYMSNGSLKMRNGYTLKTTS
ncbi:receptor kinase-like protein Xa21 [Coffea eugenioides]|uniref:Protein kinase domain-containing protein n=1 Tax=Coffea arabica TaxID=13443 RepID=A0ABM4VCJ0_COFAR|nr:receptor kinase-like protein Xa21 [Coffea eugenioides]